MTVILNPLIISYRVFSLMKVTNRCFHSHLDSFAILIQQIILILHKTDLTILDFLHYAPKGVQEPEFLILIVNDFEMK